METNSIEVKDLKVAGADLFKDGESFLDEVKGEELEMTQGGTSTTLCATVPIVITITITRTLKKA